MPRISAEQHRKGFIQAAIEVIATHGIDGATTRRLAEQAQANVAMLHYCYGSKEALFADVYEYVGSKYREVIEGSDPHTTVVDAARQILRGVMQYYLDSPAFTAATVELVNWARRQHGGRGIAIYDQALDTIRAALRDAAADSPLEPAAADEIAYVVATLTDGFAINWLTYGDNAAAEQQMEVAESVLDAWLAVRLRPEAVTA